MINVNDIKNGLTIKIDNNLYQVVEFQHVKPGKGSAFVRTKLKNLRTGTTVETTYNTNVKLETARIEKQNMQFLYSQGDTYYLFATGEGVSVMSSKDLKTWKFEKPVFAEAPQWAVEAVKGYKGHTWAPDIIYHDGLYHLFYSCSAFLMIMKIKLLI